MNMQEAVEYLNEIAKKSGAEQFDIFAGKSDSKSISVFNKALQNTEISNSCGIGIRIFKDQKPGYASTEKFSKESLEQTLADSLANSKFTEILNVELPSIAIEKEALPTYNQELENVDINHLLNTCLSIEERILAEKEIKNVPDLGAEISSSTTIFANSNGVFFTDKRNTFGVGAGAVAERNGVVKMGWYSKGGRDFGTVSVEQIADKVIARAKELLSPRHIKSGEMPVVLTKRISSNILSMYLPSFFAENAQNGLSRLANRLGEKIASEKFTLSSEPLMPDLPGSTLMDGEGIPTAPLRVVEKGEFKSFLYNMESASKENRKSTGHGSRGFAGKAGTSFMNAVVELGDKTEREMLAMFPHCLLVTHLEGGSGCDPVSGQISIGVQGFWCVNGLPVHATDNLTISSNFFDLLKNIVEIGHDYNDYFSNIKVPTLAISEMSVSA
ncbi:MAG: TldD/PmbA family protein [Fibromonadaceae bacterium]|nr:TldD/PmbA family protein [Fibromonadaceae bacterium]